MVDVKWINNEAMAAFKMRDLIVINPFASDVVLVLIDRMDVTIDVEKLDGNTFWFLGTHQYASLYLTWREKTQQFYYMLFEDRPWTCYSSEKKTELSFVNGLFTEQIIDKPVTSKSGGWESRVNLATRKQYDEYLASCGQQVKTLAGSPTNTCVECGYHNEYIDPTPGYLCRQCKIRKNLWT